MKGWQRRKLKRLEKAEAKREAWAYRLKDLSRFAAVGLVLAAQAAELLHVCGVI
ncbi:MAG: hypothetical protein ACYDDZ_11075 [Acidimicrobiales bacterium]